MEDVISHPKYAVRSIYLSISIYLYDTLTRTHTLSLSLSLSLSFSDTSDIFLKPIVLNSRFLFTTYKKCGTNSLNMFVHIYRSREQRRKQPFHGRKRFLAQDSECVCAYVHTAAAAQPAMPSRRARLPFSSLSLTFAVLTSSSSPYSPSSLSSSPPPYSTSLPPSLSLPPVFSVCHSISLYPYC